MPTTKSAQRAVNKYIKNNYDRFNLTLPKGYKSELMLLAKKDKKSLNQFILDCINQKTNLFY